MKVHVVDAFIDGESGGNAAGVLLGADSLNENQMQAIAAEMGLSETVFLSRSEKADFKLDFFTPNKRTADCGHATVAAFSLLVAEGRLSGNRSSKELINGVRDIYLDGEQVFMQQKEPEYQRVDAHLAAIAQSLGITPEAFVAPPEIVNTGTSFLMVALHDAAAVQAVVPDQDAILKISEALDLIGYYVFSTQAERPGRHAGARMFSPLYAIPEESATGMAAGPCGCYLRDRLGLTSETLLIEQGRMMAKPSPALLRVHLEISENQIRGLRVGGMGRLRTSVTLDPVLAGSI